jgi:hypothetical protein
MMLTSMPGVAFALKCLIVIVVALAFVCMIVGAVLSTADADANDEERPE